MQILVTLLSEFPFWELIERVFLVNAVLVDIRTPDTRHVEHSPYYAKNYAAYRLSADILCGEERRTAASTAEAGSDEKARLRKQRQLYPWLKKAAKKKQYNVRCPHGRRPMLVVGRLREIVLGFE